MDDAIKQAKRRARQRREINEIGDLPVIRDPERRRACEADPALWLRTYWPERFTLEFSKTQRKFIELSWETIRIGAYQNVNAYRAFGKTSILSGLMVRAHLLGITSNGIYVTAQTGIGKNTYRAFRDLLFESQPREGEEYNRPIVQDYPEVCYPYSIRDGVAQKPLTYHGQPTNIVISPREITFPVIAGSRCNGSIFSFCSIGSDGIRGTFHSVPGRGVLRPDLVMIDDVQSDGKAKSETEVNSIIEVIQSSIGQLSGYDNAGNRISLTVLSALTQNQPRDVAQRIIDEMPEFGTVIYRFLRQVPDEFTPWMEYKKFRDQTYRRLADKKIKAREELVKYYNQHRSEIEYHTEPDNPRIHETWQVSAVHYALEQWCKSEKSFWCELQNDSVRASQESSGTLTPILVLRSKRAKDPDLKTTEELKPKLIRFQIPQDTKLLTAFIDAGEHYLNYQVTAFGEDFKFAHVVDFGVFPDQVVYPIRKKSFRIDLQEVYQEGDKFERLAQATVDCLRQIFDQQYFDSNGIPFEIDQETGFSQHAIPAGGHRQQFRFLSICGVDCSDGEMEQSLWGAIDRFHRIENGRYFGRAIPTYGDEATARLMRYYDLKRGEYRRGGRRETGAFDWIENPIRSSGVVKRYTNVYASLLYDANTFKTWRDDAWKTTGNQEGAETLFDDDNAEYLQMFADQQCSEDYVEGKKSNLRYNRWRIKKPQIADNEFLDTDAGCWALASYVGIDRSTGKVKPKLNIRIVE